MRASIFVPHRRTTNVSPWAWPLMGSSEQSGGGAGPTKAASNPPSLASRLYALPAPLVWNVLTFWASSRDPDY